MAPGHAPRLKCETMLQKHLDLATGEVVGRLTKDWVKDIASYDDGATHSRPQSRPMASLLLLCKYTICHPHGYFNVSAN